MADVKRERVTVVTPVVRVAYPYLTKLDEGRKDSTGKYGIQLLIPKDKVWPEQCKHLREAVLKCAREYFKNPELKLSEFTHPFSDGDELQNDLYAGYIRLSPKTQFKPGISTPAGAPMSDEDAERIKSGDYGRAMLSVFPYNVKGKTGITFGLEVFQFSHAGDAIGGGSRASQIKMLGEVEVPLSEMTKEKTKEEANGEDDDLGASTKKKPRNTVKSTTTDADDLII